MDEQDWRRPDRGDMVHYRPPAPLERQCTLAIVEATTPDAVMGVGERKVTVSFTGPSGQLVSTEVKHCDHGCPRSWHWPDEDHG